MPHISKKKLKQEIFEEIHKSFLKALSRSGRSNSIEFFSSQFFTKTERIMFAKRLAIIALLQKEFSYYKIENLLKVSPSTVARIDNNLQQGQYNSLIKILKIRTKEESFWKNLEKVLRAGLPEMGKNRWEWLDDI